MTDRKYDLDVLPIRIGLHWYTALQLELKLQCVHIIFLIKYF